MARNISKIQSLLILNCLMLGSHCGYHLRRSGVVFEVNRVSVAPVKSKTFKAGVESTVYNHLVQSLLSHRQLQFCSDPSQADAVLETEVLVASSVPSAFTQVPQLRPSGVGAALPSASFAVATEYVATLTCSFQLVKKRGLHSGESSVLWSTTLTRSRPYPASNQLDFLGTTSSLINQSEWDRALVDMAQSMMEDLHESMLAMF